MACKYELFDNPSASSEGKTRMHPRPLNNGKVDTEYIIKQMARSSINSDGMIKAVLDDFFDYVSEHLAEGRNVHIEGLGDFRITLSSDVVIKRPEDVRAGSIKVDGIGFRPQKKLMNSLKQNTTFVRTHSLHADTETPFAILSYVQEYFNKPEKAGMAITTRYISAITGLSQKKASECLHALVTAGYLTNPSPDVHHPIYLPTEKLLNHKS